MFNLTPVIRNLILINVIVAVTDWLVFRGNLVGFLGLFSPQTDLFKPYQLFTYMFAHGGFSHIFFNMLALAFMGPILENYWGPRRFLFFYIATGIGAAVFNILLGFFIASANFGVMVGASGAIYGVLMGFGMQFPNMQVMLLIPPIPIKAKYLVFLMGGMTFLLDRSGQVAHYAHLGGIVVAFIIIRIWRSRGMY